MNVAYKKRLLEDIAQIKSNEFVKGDNQVLKLLNELLNDIENDFFTVVVLGEFKRGKSTFVNALLGQEILPTDILPETATINAVMYSEEPILTVVKQDGTQIVGEVSRNYLKQFSAGNISNRTSEIKYIKIGYPLDFLKDRVVLVDTPGVSDINEQRCEITYRFLPKANAIIFLLDANSPLKKSEKDFIDKHLLPMGIERIIFLANKYDEVDEEDDENLLEFLKYRLREAFKTDNKDVELKEIILYPLSAQMAIDGIVNDDEQLVAESGITEVAAKIKEILVSGTVEEEKLKNYQYRLCSILKIKVQDLKNDLAIRQTNLEQLCKMNRELENLLSHVESNQDKIRQFVQSECEAIERMAAKSIAVFQNRLTEKVFDDIKFYKGADFKDYVEQRVSKYIQRELENWVVEYSPHINRFLKAIENELSRGLSYHFNKAINLQSASREVQNKRFCLDISVTDVSDATIKAGAMAAGGAGLMLLIGSPILLPFISMAAFPLLQKHVLEKKLSAAKDETIPIVSSQIADCFSALKNEVCNVIRSNCKNIVTTAEYAYEGLVCDLQGKVGKEISRRNEVNKKNKNEIDDLNTTINNFVKIIIRNGGTL